MGSVLDAEAGCGLLVAAGFTLGFGARAGLSLVVVLVVDLDLALLRVETMLTETLKTDLEQNEGRVNVARLYEIRFRSFLM